MFEKEEYLLLDFGEQRRLEKFGPVILDRYCPAAEGIRKSAPDLWRTADARFLVDYQRNRDQLGSRGHWLPLSEKGKFYFPEDSQRLANPLDISKTPVLSDSKSLNLPKSVGLSQDEELKSGQKAFPSWTIRHKDAPFTLELKGSPFGHLGIFPEQSSNWDFIFRFCRDFQIKNNRPAKVMNLFAYTGGSTLAAAAGGADVVHLDAAGNIVRQARKNAELSFSEQKPIHWIVEDAVKYIRRALKRANLYEGIILDPPAYGHGASGQVWRLTRDLPKLLADLASLLAKNSSFILLTCHTDEIGLRKIAEWMKLYFPERKTISEPIFIQSQQGKRLPAGHKFLAIS